MISTPDIPNLDLVIIYLLGEKILSIGSTKNCHKLKKMHFQFIDSGFENSSGSQENYPLNKVKASKQIS